jgi:hypothetical protein
VPQADSCTADEEARRQEKARDAAGNTSGASNTASATTQASGGGINGSYSTTFPLTENPISEGGSWTNGGATGLGWANVQTTPGLSFGTGPVNAGTYLYADPTAVLKGAWAQDQQVQATVKVRGAYGRACCKEVELLIRMTIARNSITGYELNCSVVSAGPYQYLHRLQKRRTGPPGTDATFQKGSPGVGFYNSVDTTEWIWFEHRRANRVFRHHSARIRRR